MNDLPDNNADESVRWLGQAEEDLLVARVLAADGTLPPRAACFHAHLAAEKAQKALLIRIEQPFRKTHDLVELVRLLGARAPRDLEGVDLMVLEPWVLEGRYPNAVADASGADADACVASAQRVVQENRSMFGTSQG